jgi:signal transduction histidine kinase
VTGRGLGLAVVQRIVRRYAGVLNFKSTPGQGTQFEILLPYARQEEPQFGHDLTSIEHPTMRL